MIFDGMLSLYKLQNVAPKGFMPVEKLVKYADAYFGNRTLGYNRVYTALRANQQIDRLVRIWHDDNVNVKDYVIIDNEQYRIELVQHAKDGDGLKITDLTLVKLEKNYDCVTE